MPCFFNSSDAAVHVTCLMPGTRCVCRFFLFEKTSKNQPPRDSVRGMNRLLPPPSFIFSIYPCVWQHIFNSTCMSALHVCDADMKHEKAISNRFEFRTSEEPQHPISKSLPTSACYACVLGIAPTARTRVQQTQAVCIVAVPQSVSSQRFRVAWCVLWGKIVRPHHPDTRCTGPLQSAS